MHLGGSYWRFWAASGLSNIADGIFGLSIALVALDITRSPILISGLDLAAQLPWLLFALIAGALADRLDRRRVLFWVDILRVAVLAVLVLASLADHRSIGILYVAALVMGVGETLYDTSAQSIVPSVVARDDLERANGRMQGIEIVSNYFVGPPLGGLLVGVSSVLAFSTGSAIYLIAALFVLSVRGAFRPERAGPPTTIRTDIVEGLRYLRDQPVLRRLGLITGGRMFTFTAVSAVLPIYAVAPGPMKLSAGGFGFFIASTAIGAVISSLVGERTVARLGAARCLKLTMLAFAVTELSPLAVNPFAVGALWMVGTYFVIIWNVITLSTRQRIVPERLLGRVNSVYRLVSLGAMPLGAAAGGVFAQLTSPRLTFVVCGAATVLLALATLPITDASLAGPEEPPPADLTDEPGGPADLAGAADPRSVTE